jgi:alpha-ribazole phosphatase
MGTIFLVRHAEPVGVDQQKRYLGQLDPDLSPVGIRQAEKLGLAFRLVPIEAVFTSDLVRAAHTASLIAENRDSQPIMVREFREISLGEWEGRTFQEIQSQYPEEYERRGRDIADYRTPGGESFADLQRRVLPAFAAVVEKTKGNLLIVAHASVNRIILCHLMKRPPQELFSIPQDYAAVNVLSENAGACRVVAVNVDSDNLTSHADVAGQSW